MHVQVHETAREQFTLTSLAFTRLLTWLDDGVDSHGERYNEVRRRLISYFDRRNRLGACELADVTLGRIAATLQAAEPIETASPARYCYAVARSILNEDLGRERGENRSCAAAAVGDGPGVPGAPERALTIREDRLQSLERCLQSLPLDQRQLIVEYYRDARRHGIDHRRRMAERLALSRTALSVRTWRIREQLMNCAMEGAVGAGDRRHALSGPAKAIGPRHPIGGEARGSVRGARSSS